MSENMGFMLFKSYESIINDLTREEIGDLILLLFDFFNTWEKPEIENRAVRMAFNMISADMVRADEKWQVKCSKNAENGAKGGRPKKENPKKANGFSENPKKPNGFSENPRKPKKPNINTNININTKENISDPIVYSSADLKTGHAEPEADCEAIILNDGSEWKPTQAIFEEWIRLFPAVDVPQELRKMRSWTLANPKNRKTRSGAQRFVSAWLSKAQNSAPPGKRKTRFDNFESRGTDYDSMVWSAISNGSV